MQKLISALLIMLLALPVPVFAQALSPTDPNSPVNPSNPIFAPLKSKLIANIQVPIYKADGTVSGQGPSPLYTMAQAQSDVAQAVSAGKPGAAACNPVVWASLMQEYQQHVAQDVAAAIAMNNRMTPALNNKCIPNAAGKDRQTLIQTIEQKLQQMAQSAICSLNWSSIFGFNIDISLGICKNGQLFSANASASSNAQTTVNGQDVFGQSGCVTPGGINQGSVTNAVTLSGQLANNPNLSSLNVPSVAMPTSNGGTTIGIIHAGSGGSGNGGGNLLQQSAAPPPVVTPAPAPTPPAPTNPPPRNIYN